MPSGRILAAALAVALLAPGTGQAANPSFDCAKAATAVEKLLCADDALARQDRLLAAVYKRALDRADTGEAKAIRAGQRDWARGRAAACPPADAGAAACLTARYKDRIAALRPLSFDDLRLYPGVDVQADRRAPLACVRFDSPLLAKQTAALESYVASAGGETLAARVNGDALCIEGLAHGAEHRLTVKQGLAGEGAVLREDVTFDLAIPDRPRRVAFPSKGLILPRLDAAGLPIETVNVPLVRALLLRVDDAQVIEGLRQGLIDRQISYAEVGRVASRLGRNVWTGDIEVDAAPNVAARTAIPIGEIAPDLEPGVYLAVAEDPEADFDGGWWAASQWFVVSDIGLTAFVGADGLAVAARSLASAAPTPGARIALVASGGDILAEATTDEQGLARIPPGFLRGEDGASPRAVYAYGAAGDFVYLDLARAPLDLSDRGVDGRTAPGALDAYLRAERGVYRPGERVYLTALLRDAAAGAVEGLPVTLKVVRHDGLEVFRQALQDKGAGGYTAELDLPPTAATGVWRATLHADPSGPAVGQTRFLVEDFVPPRLEVLLDAGADGPTVRADIAANYLYGAPAANLPGEATLDVRPASSPVAGAEGYRFGRAQEEAPQSYRAAQRRFETDSDGLVRLDIGVGDWPGTSYPLEARLRASLFDVGGRPVDAAAIVPLDNLPILVGIKPLFEDGVPEGGVAAFDVRAFAPDGTGLDRALDYAIVREDIEYIWFQSGGRWDYRVQYLDMATVDAGAVAVAADAPARIERRFDDWGGYRIDVTDTDTGVGASVRFRAGWWGAETAQAEPQPDKVKVTLPPGPFAPGDEVRAVIEPPFDAEVMATVIDGSLREVKTATIPASGGEIALRLPADGAGGAYILVNAFAAAEGVRSLAPRRAIGAAYAAFDPAPKSLAVSLTAPAETEPARTVDVVVDVGPAGDRAFVALAAVDDGVLGLTDYGAPDPQDHFLGKRRLGMDLRDVYGRFIDAAGAAVGRVRSGGDEELAAKADLADLPDKTVEVVALFSGVVEVGADGRAVVPLRLPEFSGRLRLMAQAWSADRVGAAETTMLIRRPAVARIALPRFLSPGDTASVSISLRNLSGPTGEYAARLSVTGPLTTAADAGLTSTLSPTDLAAIASVQLVAGDPGDGAVRLDVTGPGGLAFTVERTLSVRPSAPVETRSYRAVVGPGETLTAPDDVFAGVYRASAHVAAGLNPLPDMDLPSILAGLRRYPYGCTEQTTSTAAPLLYAAGLARDMGLLRGVPPADGVAEGVARLLGMQTYSGGFGFWDSSYEAAPWITAYATDFLVQAQRTGATVPAEPLARALGRLSVAVDDAFRTDRDYAASAYALYVRARAGVADPARVRRFAEQVGGGRRSALAFAFAGGALAAVGDTAAATAMFERSRTAAPVRADVGYRNYGSPVRDRAAVLTLMAESGAVEWPALETDALSLSEAIRERRWLSTQEQAWIVRAAAALADASDAGGFAAEVDGVRVGGAGAGLYRHAAMTAGPPTLRNLGARPVTGVITVTGAATAPRPAADAGFAVQRTIYSSAGDKLDPTALRQNDAVVVLLEGVQSATGRARALLVDYLPAGLELENARLGGGDLGAYGWLGRLTQPEHQELRDDRFVAAFPSEGGRRFRVAYLARVVTPGRFAHGGAHVEAMYRPEQFGRSASTVAVVTGR